MGDEKTIPEDTVEGTLDRVLYANEDTGWSVVRIFGKAPKIRITAVGHLFGVQPGEELRLQGSWTVDPKFGRQFRAVSYVPIYPSTLEGIERYLGSGLVPGLGATIASRVVNHFQLETLTVIDTQPERLTEVSGIGELRADRIRSAWATQQQLRALVIFLHSNGVSSGHARKIYRTYGSKAISVVRTNPYRLALDVFGIGFQTADAIATKLGISPDDPSRIDAGVLYALSKLSSHGHVYSPRQLLIQHSIATLECDAHLVEDALPRLATSEKIVVETTEHDDVVYLSALHQAESLSAKRVKCLIDHARPPTIKAGAMAAAISDFESRYLITLAPSQRIAIDAAQSHPLLVITGGPGTGKTTIVNAVIQVLERSFRRVLLAAPTGRAAKRLEETTGKRAATLHRLLEYSPKSRRFERNQDHQLIVDTLIVDEASMIDITLFAALLDALPDTCQVILVGDVDQLPSVGAGDVLRDLITSGATRLVRLSEIFRQATCSDIIVNAHRVNRGEIPVTTASESPGGDIEPTSLDQEHLRDFYFVERDSPDAILETTKDLVAHRISQRFGLHPIDDIQVLTPMRRGDLGTFKLNTLLQAALNPGGEHLILGKREFRLGDKVMQMRNNYELEVFNGDIGRIARVDRGERQVTISYDGREVNYDYGALDEISLAYATSIHKAQGSEYPAIVVILHTQHYMLLQRNLLYTAITRGKQLVVIVGTTKAARVAVSKPGTGVRYSRLADRLTTHQWGP